MFRTVKAALLAAALTARTASGQEDVSQDHDEETSQDALTHEQLHGMHGKIDTDKDGKASMAEVLKFSADMRRLIAEKDVKTVLEEMDGDKDGKLSLPELLKDMDQWSEGDEEERKETEGRKELERQKFKVADANGDGFIEEKELPALFYPETHEGVLDITAKATLAQKDRNGDGMLTLKEFWESDPVEGEELSISDEEKGDFANLDKDGNTMLDLAELKLWESGRFHTEEAMKKLFDLADKDSDMRVTAEEFSAAREQLAGSDAHFHLMEWAEHSEL
mmetsp:Transcript_19452/g.61190  ORF Transcript_19452/g.61190 Transcript_19452/m.61190 type:complete len:278 (-) Transcript_19452:97-930(-)|eukprot:CAMPEP_0204599488 /NCGR_PEP_ID=MMETSP0661-20131031/54853_1 /ASSEMBLY_ACC=CAM_ASM_000606 /TAXON_ID=109239 /ORGANISM="Alexandrium margalefi, Strain AMGDE01CS-322" /LENGTH=277 /DNA_ID=CAMNT_0051610215 /DNA_START=39 /DNA_END=872 /DNA_ORIENTATION=+